MKYRYIFASIIYYFFVFNSAYAQKIDYSLPSPIKITPDEAELNEELILEFIAYPISVSYTSVLTLADKKVLSFPILMEEENLPIKSSAKLMDPLRWESKGYNTGVGRSSIWFMEKNREMLYSILIDIDNFPDSIGIGYVSVIRLTDEIYDWILRGPNDELLYVVRGEKIVLDESVGASTFISLEDQEDVNQYHDFLWKDLPPNKFVMFTR